MNSLNDVLYGISKAQNDRIKHLASEAAQAAVLIQCEDAVLGNQLSLREIETETKDARAIYRLGFESGRLSQLETAIRVADQYMRLFEHFIGDAEQGDELVVTSDIVMALKDARAHIRELVK